MLKMIKKVNDNYTNTVQTYSKENILPCVCGASNYLIKRQTNGCVPRDS